MALQLQILTTFLDPCPHMLVWQNPCLAEVRQFFLQIKVLQVTKFKYVVQMLGSPKSGSIYM